MDDRITVSACAVLCAGLALAGNPLDNIGNVKLKGYLGERLDAMIARHVGGADVDYITAPFQEKTERRGWWQTEFWGKWMHSAVPYLAYTGDAKLKSAIDHGIDRMLASQEPNGYIGNYPDELRMGEGWDVWGVKYTLMGLLHYYDLCGGGSKSEVEVEQRRDRVLTAAKKLCDYVIAEIGPNGKRGRELWQTGNWSGYASSSILEPVMWLYQRTKEKRYLDFATYIVRGMTEPESGPRLVDLTKKGVPVADRDAYGRDPKAKKEDSWSYVCKYGRSKAYEMMSCYQGLSEYCSRGDDVFDDELFGVVAAAGELIRRDEINLAGGCASSEAWYHGAKKQHLPYVRLHETCVTTTWMRFCEMLLEKTNDPKWADELEKTFYNAYLGAMKADGSEFAGYTPLTGNRWHGQHHCYMHTDCCTANGPRGFLCFLRELCRNDGRCATFNFYTSALVKGFDMYSLYPRKDYVHIVSHTEGPLAVRFRIPGWSAKTRVKLNGEEQPGVRAGTYFTLDRTWKLGDTVELWFDMPVVSHVIDHHVAFTRGPILLARDSRFNDGDFTEPFRKSIGDCRQTDLGGGRVQPSFREVRTPSDEMWMAFSATLELGSHHENPEAANPTTVFFCDYASAGNRWMRDNYYRTWFPIEYSQKE